jgi:hypothetical protein
MTTPSGRLAWGQAGNYDAADDRAVIAAVSGLRTGLVTPLTARPGAGLFVIIDGGWLGIADCGDGTSGVVGDRGDLAVEANPGPATGERLDVIWCDVEPDEGTWELNVITAAEAAGRPGIPLVYLTVPAGAALAAQMDITPAERDIERRLLWQSAQSNAGTGSGTTWGTAATVVWTRDAGLPHVPGHWYRAVFQANSVMAVSGSLAGRIGVGSAPAFGTEGQTELGQATAIMYPAYNREGTARVEWVYRFDGPAPQNRLYRGRIWSAGIGQYRPNNVGSTLGAGLLLTIEDMGT